MKMFSIKDMKGQMFLKPTFAMSVADALRNFEVLSNEGESMISKFPADFRLFHLADFDINSGDLTILERPADLGAALDFKRSVPQTELPFNKQ